jgi:hypothetical protein
VLQDRHGPVDVILIVFSFSIRYQHWRRRIDDKTFDTFTPNVSISFLNSLKKCSDASNRSIDLLRRISGVLAHHLFNYGTEEFLSFMDETSQLSDPDRRKIRRPHPKKSPLNSI